MFNSHYLRENNFSFRKIIYQTLLIHLPYLSYNHPFLSCSVHCIHFTSNQNSLVSAEFALLYIRFNCKGRQTTLHNNPGFLFSTDPKHPKRKRYNHKPFFNEIIFYFVILVFSFALSVQQLVAKAVRRANP